MSVFKDPLLLRNPRVGKEIHGNVSAPSEIRISFETSTVPSVFSQWTRSLSVSVSSLNEILCPEGIRGKAPSAETHRVAGV